MRHDGATFRILGPPELCPDGQPTQLGSARVRSVLAILLLTPRTVVPVDTLIDHLWDTQPPPKARESLSVYIARLRKALRGALGDNVRIDSRARGYALEVDPDDVDLHQFRRLRRQAGALAASGEHDRAAVLLREAEALWHGQALAGLRGDWASRMRDSLEEERRAAILDRVHCELELGRHADLVGELGGLLVRYPLDETFVGLQMTALYRSGRPGDALALYRETRSRLIDEQGTEPGQALADLQQRILQRDPALAFSGPRRGRAASLPADLPPGPDEFVGRSAELALLTGEHSPAPQVSVIEGGAGAGKTALAVQAARLASKRFPDGLLYLDLAGASRDQLDPAEALHRLLRMLGVPASQIPDRAADRAELWRSQLSRRQAVVVLDDAAGREQVSPLLPEGGPSLILITTRRHLAGLDAVRVIALDALPPDDSATLFTRISGPGRARDGGAVTAAVELCGGWPLAIQLTGSRFAQAGQQDLAGLVAELARADLPPRNPVAAAGEASPEVLAAVELSYRTLAPAHQQFFRRLGLNPCTSVSVAAAAALAGCGLEQAQSALSALAEQHLLTPVADGHYRFHDLIRLQAGQAAAADPAAERRSAVRRFLDYYLATADQADRVLHPFRHRLPVAAPQAPCAAPALAGADDAAAWLDAEWRNIVQAARHAGRNGWQQQCADLVHVVADFVEIRGYWEEAIAAHTLALQACRELGDPVRIAQASVELSVVSQQAGRHDGTLALAQDAADVYRSLNDMRGLAEALDQAGMVHQRAGRVREALAYFGEAEITYRKAGDRHGMADALSHTGIASWQLGRHGDARHHLQQALDVYRAVGARRGEAKTLYNLGKMQMHSGFHRDAMDSFQQSLAIFTAIGGPQHQAILYQGIAWVHQHHSEYAQAFTAYRQALAIYRELGDLPDQANALSDIGSLYLVTERFDEAMAHYQQARMLAEEIGDRVEQVSALRGIGDTARDSGRIREALACYDQALRLSRQIGNPYEEGMILAGLAETVLVTEGATAARITFRQALDLFEMLGVPEADRVRMRIEALDPGLITTANTCLLLSS